MSLLGSIGNIAEKVGSAAVGLLPARKITYSSPSDAQTPQTTPEQVYHVPGRDLTLSSADLAVLRPVLYGEVSNRNATKKDLEARVILNTALNRMQAYAAHGQKKSLSDILSAPNQYQAYGGDQYSQYSNPPDAVAAAKKKQVDDIVQNFLNEMEGGDFPDVTQGAYYYQHHPNGTIEYDNKRPLFNSALGLK